MSVTILPIEDHKKYNVNGHIVYKDDKGHWQGKSEMSSNEWVAFRNYEKVVINNKAFAKHTKSIFKTK